MKPLMTYSRQIIVIFSSVFIWDAGYHNPNYVLSSFWFYPMMNEMFDFFFLIDKEIKKLKLLAYLKMSSAQFICISSDEDDDYVPPSILNLSTQQQVKSKESPELSKMGIFFLLIFC